MNTSQRVDLVAQPERAGDLGRQIGGAFGTQTRTDHRSHAVAIGKREKSIPITPRSISSCIAALSANGPDAAQHLSNRSLSASGVRKVAEFILIVERFTGCALSKRSRSTLSNLGPHCQTAEFRLPEDDGIQPVYPVIAAARTRGLSEAYVHVHNHGSGDMLPGAVCLQSFQFVHCSHHGSEKLAFVPSDV